MRRSAAAATTDAVAVEELLPATGSVRALLTLAVFATEPDDAVTVPESVMVGAVAPDARPVRVQVMVVVPLQVQPLPLAVADVIPDGTTSVTVTEAGTSEGPMLST